MPVPVHPALGAESPDDGQKLPVRYSPLRSDALVHEDLAHEFYLLRRGPDGAIAVLDQAVDDVQADLVQEGDDEAAREGDVGGLVVKIELDVALRNGVGVLEMIDAE